MAAIPPAVTDSHRRSSSSTRKHNHFSHGRGGAGNMGVSTADHLDPTDLQTPTIKSEVFTTGRGGSGNMAQNKDPLLARKAQDVEISHPRRESTSDVHVGRGGAANVFKPSAEEIATAKRDNERWESAILAEESKASSDKGLAEKGKEWLFGHHKPTKA